MKKLLTFILTLGLLIPAIASAQFTTVQGGTGTSSPSGVLFGDGTLHLKTLNIGSNLTLTGGTLSASGGGGASSFGTTSLSALYPLIYTTSASLAQFSLSGYATTTASCTGTASCSPFVILGSSPITITGATGSSASSTLLGDTNTWSGTEKFNNLITGSISGNAGTATALAANGTNCTAGNYALGVDASGNAEGCTAAAVGTVTSVTATYPILATVGAAPVISTAFGTTTGWGLGNNGLLMTDASGKPFVTATSSAVALSISGNAATVTTNANLSGVVTSVGNTTSFGSQTAGVLGNPITGNTAPMATSTLFGVPPAGGYVLGATGGVIAWIATSSGGGTPGGTSGQLQYNASGNFGGTATTSLTASGVLSLSQPISVIGGSASALTLTGGANGQVLGWLSGIPTWTASSSIVAGSNITISTAGAATTINCASCLTGNQTITLSGAVTGTGATAITTAYGTLGQGVLGNPFAAATIPTALSTSTLYGAASTGGYVLGWSNALNGLTLMATSSSGGAGGIADPFTHPNIWTSATTSALQIATTSTQAFQVNDQYATNILNINTASTTGSIFAVFATTSTATSCGGAGISCLFQIDQYGHITASSTVPVLSSCGTSPSLTSDSSDWNGSITVGSVAATTCTLTFGRPHTIGTHCNLTSQTGTIAISYTESLTGFVFTNAALTGDIVDYTCGGL